MKIVFILDSYNKRSGSFYSTVYNLNKALLKKNVDVQILTSNILKKNKKLFYDIVLKSEICHFFGGWSFFHIKSFLIATKFKKIRIIHPMGFYEPWALKHKFLKKKICWHLYQKKILSMADSIHAASEKEKKNLLKLNNNFKIDVLPFGINKKFFKKKIAKKNLKYKAIFFSRLHKVKGLCLLIEAWNELNNQRWRLDIVGPKDDSTFYNKIKKILKNNSRNTIRFLPPVFKDNKKIKLFDDYDFLVLPSKSENFGMVILESLACGLPVLTTTNTPWKIIKEHNAGWIIKDNYCNLISALKKIFLLKLEKFNIKSNNAINLAKKYEINIIIKNYLKVYAKLLKKNN